MMRSWRWNLGIKAIRPFLNKVSRNGSADETKTPLRGWSRSRDLPPVADKTFHERMKDEGKK
jgi:hypothetical protein